MGYDGAQLLFTDPGLDVTLIQLNDDDVDQEALYGSYILDNGDIDIAEEIYIPQHPGARAKEIGLTDTFSNTKECKILGFRNGCTDSSIQDVLYTCDTEGGSSGSPVVSRKNYQAIAIHHCGGGCNGNMGIPVKLWFDLIEEWVGPLSPTISPAPTGPQPSRSPSAAPTPCENELFELELKTDRYASETSWELTDSAGSLIMESEFLADETGYFEAACVVGCVNFTIYDSYSDGICCSHGEGEYKVYYNKVLKKEGGRFGLFETIALGCEESAKV